MLGAVTLDHLVLRDPVDLPPDRSQVTGLNGGEHSLPQVEHPRCHRVVEPSTVCECRGLFVVLGLDLQRGELTPVHQLVRGGVPWGRD